MSELYDVYPSHSWTFSLTGTVTWCSTSYGFLVLKDETGNCSLFNIKDKWIRRGDKVIAKGFAHVNSRRDPWIDEISIVKLGFEPLPEPEKKLDASGFKLDSRVRVNEPLGFNDYNNLQMNALAVVSDSGTLPEESSFYLSINSPIAAVCIRTSTERPEAIEAGDFIIAGITTDELLQATEMAIEMKKNKVLGKPCPDYIDTCVSMKVIRIIQSYVNIVNRMVWRKE